MPCSPVVFAQSAEARCKVENEDVVGAAHAQALLQLHLSDQQFYCLLRCAYILEVWRYTRFTLWFALLCFVGAWHWPMSSISQHGSFWVWAQRIKENVTLYRSLSKAEPMPAGITIIKLQPDLALTIDTPYLRPHGRAMGYLSWVIRKKWPRYIESTVYFIGTVVFGCHSARATTGRDWNKYRFYRQPWELSIL